MRLGTAYKALGQPLGQRANCHVSHGGCRVGNVCKRQMVQDGASQAETPRQVDMEEVSGSNPL